MAVGAVFLIVIVIVVVAVAAVGLYALAGWLRHKQLDPEGDKVEPAPEEPARPDHSKVESEQRTRFVGTR